MRKFLLSILIAQIAVAAAVNYSYDSAGRLIKVDYGTAGSISYTYDKAGNLLSRIATTTATAGAPVLTSLSSTSAAAGSTTLVLTVTGSGFVSGSTVMWNTTALTTTFVSATQLTANVTVNLLAAAGSASVTVSNAGVASNAITFTITAATGGTLTITSLNPTFATAGGAGFTLTVDGSGFTASSVIQWNAAPLATTFVNSTQLTANVNAPLIATAALVPVIVVNGAVNSNSLIFDISAKAPSVTSALPHFAAQDIWTTGIFAVNTGVSQANFAITFRDDTGAPLALPFASGTTSTLTGTLPALGSAYYETGNPAGALLSGWGQVSSDPSIVIQALFRENASGTYYEAAVPSNSGSKEFEIPFDATTFAATGDQFFTGFAIANFDAATAANVTCTARDNAGAVIAGAFDSTTGPPQLPAMGHWAGYLFPKLTGKRGTIDCTSNTNIAATALRFIGTNAFSSLPVVNKPATASPVTSALSHFAAQDIWTTGVFVINTGTTPANYAIAFKDDNGAAVAMPFTSGTTSNLSGLLGANASAYFETANPAGGLLSGWGKITSDPTIVIQALFREATGAQYFEAAVPSNPGSKEFLIPFDVTTFAATGDQFYTGFAISNLDAANAATITCTARDGNGTLIPSAFTPATGPPQIAASGHWAGYLFPVLTGKRGTIDCVSTTNIAATALRFIGTNAFSSLPVIVK